MHSLVRAAAPAVLALAALPAQAVSHIPSMTVGHSIIDMDAVGPVGPTTVAAINLAGTPVPGNIANITLSPTTAAPGVYNTNTTEGRALGLGPGGLELVDPSGPFVSFNAQIDLGQPSTEFGCCIADWVSSMVLDFYLGSTLVATFTSTSYSTAAAKFYAMTGGVFDRVDIRASTTAGNWVIPCLYVENGGSSYATARTFGTGCGNPVLALASSARPVLGTTIDLVTTGTGNGQLGATLLSLSRFDPGIPLSGLGMTGCFEYAGLDVPFLFMPAGGTARVSLAIPGDPRFATVEIHSQSIAFIPGINPFGATTSNGLTLRLDAN